jgi:hypothetical protein
LAAFAAVIGGGYGWSWAGSLFASTQSAEREVIYWVWVVQEFLAGITIVAIASARSAAASTLEPRRKLPRRRPVVTALGALALVLFALKAWPLGSESVRSREWFALAASAGVLVALVVLVTVEIAELRKAAKSCGVTGTRCA